MSPKSLQRTAVRSFIVAVLVAGAMPVSATEADARGGRVGAAVAAGRSGAAIHRSQDDKRNKEEAASETEDAASKAADDATAAEQPESDGSPIIARVEVLKPGAKSGPGRAEEPQIPGCVAGMICTICLAGCAGPVDGIVYAERKQQ